LEPSALVVIVLVAGFVVALPALVWGLRDVKKIPGGVWRHAAERPRRQWRVGMISCYLLAGWPAIVAVVAWRRSRERADLLAEWAVLSRRKKAARQRATPPRAAAQPDIVLADYEESPSRRMGRADA
jgi:hypothetical protein